SRVATDEHARPEHQRRGAKNRGVKPDLVFFLGVGNAYVFFGRLLACPALLATQPAHRIHEEELVAGYIGEDEIAERVGITQDEDAVLVQVIQRIFFFVLVLLFGVFFLLVLVRRLGLCLVRS